jgi:hypothetical protein
MTRKTFKSAVLGTAAAAMAAAALAPSLAAAQPRYQDGAAWDENGQYYYDGCARDTTNRTITGGLIGAGAGAIIGNSLVDKRRDHGSGAVMGGILGAFAGAAIGGGTAACQPQPRPVVVQAPPPPRVAQRYAPPPPPVSRPPVYEDRYAYRDAPYGYRDDPDYRYAPVPSEPPCTYIEDSVRMPNGSMARRMVHVCMDSRGQYQIVD